MKRLLFVIISGILAAGMALSLSACSVDITTDSGKKIHLGPDVLEELETIDWDEILDGVSDLQDAKEELVEGLQEAFEEGSSELEDIMDELDDIDWEQLLDTIASSSGDSAGWQNEWAEDYEEETTVEEFTWSFGIEEETTVWDDEIEEEETTPEEIIWDYKFDEDTLKEEVLDQIENLLDDENLSDYIEQIQEQFESNPQWEEFFMNPTGEGNIINEFITGIQSIMPNQGPVEIDSSDAGSDYIEIDAETDDSFEEPASEEETTTAAFGFRVN